MQKLNKTLIFFLIFTIISSALAFKIVVSAYSSYDVPYDEISLSGKLARIDHADKIAVSSPKVNETIQSPLVVKGKARGNWYFEASFPVRLLDANGKELAVVPAQAKGEWMTTNFVPFEVMLTFDKPATATGTLVLQKDNASGLPEHDASISIPVRFSK
jgi:hypothetical protein